MLVALLTLAACGGATHPPPTGLNEASATPPPGLSAAGLLAWRVWHTPRPARDVVALAQALRHVAGPIPTVARTAPLNRVVGDDDTFWVRGDAGTYQLITAKLVYVTPHVYDYVQDGATVDVSALKAAADTFENTIYPAGQRFFGSEWNPGIDDDPHITILNATDLSSDSDGYFAPADEVSRLANPYSNEREMIYLHIGVNDLTPNTEPYQQAMTHEYQHLIHYHQRPTDPTWLNQAMSLLAQHLNGYDTSAYERGFMADPMTQLDAWNAAQDANAQYAAGYLFLDFFAEHYGGYTVLKELLADPAPTPLNFNDVLARHGFAQRFDDVFAQWIVANALNDTPAVPDQYRYKTVAHQHVTAMTSVTTLPATLSDTPPQYAAAYYDVPASTGDHTLHIVFKGAATVPLLSGGPPAPGAAYWWSNRGAAMATTLTHSFDLRRLAGQPVALHFALWYDLTAGSDYGYVAASADGGKTWQTLPVAGSSNVDPNGLNFGNGITGTSGGWVPATVDLSAYAGKQTLVRFTVATDTGDEGAGLAIGQITLPALGYSESADQGAGWDARGWLRVTTDLPQRYVAWALLFPADGSAPVVEPILVGADGAGTLTVAHFGGQYSDAQIVIAPLAPGTTVPASYTLTLSQTG